MKKIETSIDKVFTTIQKMNGKSSDIKTRKIVQDQCQIGILFLQSVSSDDKISDILIHSIMEIMEDSSASGKQVFQELYNHLYNGTIKEITTYQDLFYHLVNGFTAILVEGENKAIVVETKSTLDRGIQESNTETSLRGPKDSFTENIVVNQGLIRKRIKDPNLYFEELFVGHRTKTKINLAYLSDVADQELTN